jgi:hypothetical protein
MAGTMRAIASRKTPAAIAAASTISLRLSRSVTMATASPHLSLNFRDVDYERKWLEDYCRWKDTHGAVVVSYAVEVDGRKDPTLIKCFRFLANGPNHEWLKRPWLEQPCI